MSNNTATNKPMILLVDSTTSIYSDIYAMLNATYNIIIANNNQQIIDSIKNNKSFNCILISLDMPNIDCLALTKYFKTNFETHHIPTIIIANSIKQNDMINAVEAGADDYIQKPFNAIELTTRITMNIRRSERDQNSNSLTKLPTNILINRIITERLTDNISILYLDLDNFKAYNDSYGFILGNNVIQHTVKILIESIKLHGNTTDFIGHIGGDDFIIVSTHETAEQIASTICKKFDNTIFQFYSTEHQATKKIVTLDRQGNSKEFPLLSLSIAIVSNEYRSLTSLAHISTIAAELKNYAKTKPHGLYESNYVKDRRNK